MTPALQDLEDDEEAWRKLREKKAIARAQPDDDEERRRARRVTTGEAGESEKVVDDGSGVGGEAEVRGKRRKVIEEEDETAAAQVGACMSPVYPRMLSLLCDGNWSCLSLKILWWSGLSLFSVCLFSVWCAADVAAAALAETEGPSDRDLQAKVREILQSADLATITLRIVVQQLEEVFGVSDCGRLSFRSLLWPTTRGVVLCSVVISISEFWCGRCRLRIARRRFEISSTRSLQCCAVRRRPKHDFLSIKLLQYCLILRESLAHHWSGMLFS